MARVLIPLAEGFEEIEAITLIDVLRRAGIRVTTASLKEQQVTGAHGITLQADHELDEVITDEFDMILLPGGLPGAHHLRDDERVIGKLRAMAAAGQYTAAICAAPVALAAAGLLDGKLATSYPGFLDQMTIPGMQFKAETVVQDGKVITSRGPATAMSFALHLVGLLTSANQSGQVAAGLLAR